MSAPGKIKPTDARPSFLLALVGASQVLVVLAALTLPLTSLAQGYDSAFAQYRSHKSESAAINWNDANRSAGELGGFVGQMRASPPLPRAPAGVDARSQPPMTGMAEMMKSLAGTAPHAAPGSTR